ncbi:response regulator [Chloroflexota bacterium]
MLLVVEDDKQVLRLIEAMIGPKGYDLVLISEGTKAVDVARSEKPQLILLDIMMPDTDGYSILGEMKKDQLTRDIPVIMVTALGYELNKSLADELGASGYITKPIELENLLETIVRFLLNLKLLTS